MRKILTPVLTLALAMTAAGLTGCGSSTTDDATDRPSIVVTTNVLGDIVTKALGDLVGTAVDVTVIMPVGADPHEFAASAQQAENMEKADLLVLNGLGFEAGLADVIDNALANGAIGFSFGGVVEAQSGTDPHVWMDPTRIAEVLASLPEALVASTGVAIADVETNVAAYVTELGNLDDTISATLAAIPAERRTLVTNHESLGYFADRYGFEVIGTIIPSVTTSAEASAAGLQELADLIDANAVPAIFGETTESDRLARALADEVGGAVEVVELYTESLGEPGSGADSYIGFMTIDAERIAAALA